MVFGSIKEAIDYVQTSFGHQFPLLNSLQVVLVVAGIMVLFPDVVTGGVRWSKWRYITDPNGIWIELNEGKSAARPR